jgi:eukaryotic-like serine/threonine-protein kinase
VIYFPGSYAIDLRGSQDLAPLAWDFIVKSGRAMVLPIFKGTYERGDGLRTDCPAPTSFYRDHVIQWSKELGRTIDYIETRTDLVRDKVAFYGFSWGAALGSILPAVEDRIKVSVLLHGGFYFQNTFPEVDQINFASRVTVPTLMVNGRYDSGYPVQSSQLPMFQLLGTRDSEKRHIVFETGHTPATDAMIKEMLDWLDRYVGPVK